MRKGTAFIVAAAAVAGGYFVGRFTRQATKGPESAVVAPAGVGDGVERKQVALEGAAKGAASALVHIVEFSDFQCPFCSRVNPTLERLLKEYPGKVRVYFRHFPLNFHQDAPLAAQAAEAAREQGKFWEMHDKLFANQQALKRPDLEKYAQEIGLDMGKFRAALDAGTYKARVDADMTAGQAAGVSGTPAFFVNGRSLVGAQPFEEFKKVVDEELATAQKLVASGIKPDQVYAALMRKAGQPAAPGAGQPAQPTGPPRPNVSSEVYKIPVGNAPTKGGKQPKVTLIEFSEFQCPFCARVLPTLAEVLKTYGDDVQLAFKHFPLGFHDRALPAAIAAEAAREQGKFWEMHDKLFQSTQALDRATFERYAQEIGLDLARFKAALDSDKHKDRVEADMAQAAQFGVRGTPSFFINGRLFRGAQPLENFKAVIDEELKKADEKLKEGVPRARLYAALIESGLDKAAPPPSPAARPGQPEPGVAYKVDITGAPTKGPKDALVTIVEFSDYECPFCARVEPTLARIMDEYKGNVRIAWKDLPLPFHANATPAAVAARAAGQQGKYWEMHAKLFENQKALDRASLERYAQEIGLDMARFRKAMDDPKLKAAVEADAAQASKVGASGTPAFFINGVSLSGAQPFESFKAVIDQELKKAEGLVAKGTPRAKVYETIMKNARAEAAAPAAQAQAEPSGPENDTRVHKVDPGDSPSRGPKNAPITLVLFSDYECPFCKRVEPTIAQLERDYPGKIRVVWKDYPLPFHNNAKIAAAAARAAGEQGKFWEMHAKLFEDQKALARPNLERYAQELGLDMGKFKAALDSNKFDAQIEADMKLGQSVGVSGTPASFINGRMIGGAYPYETFKKIVDQELAKKGNVAERRRRG